MDGESVAREGTNERTAREEGRETDREGTDGERIEWKDKRKRGKQWQRRDGRRNHTNYSVGADQR